MSIRLSEPPMENKKKVLFTFGTKDIEELYIDCDDQATISRGLMKDFFKDQNTNKLFLSLLCENYSLNYKLKEQLERWFEEMPITNKDGKEILTVSQTEAMLLEASVFAREEIKDDLRKKFNISNHYN
mgnify:CR=1 FL=1